ncbi:hypothetical protein I7I51_02932 [Histoplasma capsulatum]|uniref:Uncharacterized protein n=1 Tax=Ajellomyces capsulatus TaxID=5037 RepID=A0A8A1MQ51_AJECA|nr:hypothetical protein I7I51_02932 [Histoplasma capsulatum]
MVHLYPVHPYLCQPHHIDSSLLEDHAAADGDWMWMAAVFGWESSSTNFRAWSNRRLILKYRQGSGFLETRSQNAKFMNRNMTRQLKNDAKWFQLLEVELARSIVGRAL